LSENILFNLSFNELTIRPDMISKEMISFWKNIKKDKKIKVRESKREIKRGNITHY